MVRAANPLGGRRRFDDLQIQNKGVSGSPQPLEEMPMMEGIHGVRSQEKKSLPPVKAKNVPISDPVFLQKDHGHSKGKKNLLDIGGNHEENQDQANNQQKVNGGTGTDDALLDVDFESDGNNQQLYAEESEQQNLGDEEVQAVQNYGEEEEGEDGEGESVYMIDGVVMRMI